MPPVPTPSVSLRSTSPPDRGSRPRTPIFYGGAIKTAGNNLPAREKPRIGFCAPTAAANRWLNVHLFLQEASRLPLCPRERAQLDGSVTETCAGLPERCGETPPRSGTAPGCGFRRLLRRLFAGPFRAPPAPRGYIQKGGRSGNPMEAQRSGFHWERTSDGMSEPCPLGRGEGYAVREDEIGRFKERGFQRGEADSPYQGEMSRRDKGGRALEIPLPFDGSLVTFCLHRKSLARKRNIPISRPAPR